MKGRTDLMAILGVFCFIILGGLSIQFAPTDEMRLIAFGFFIFGLGTQLCIAMSDGKVYALYDRRS